MRQASGPELFVVKSLLMPNIQRVHLSYKKLVSEIASLYEGARKALVEAYWTIGKRIVEVEQQGDIKVAYGTGLLQKLSDLQRDVETIALDYWNLLRLRRGLDVPV